MPSRRKLIEQVNTNTVGLGEKVSAGTTTAHISGVIDRKGALSILMIGSIMSLSVADTAQFSTTLLTSALTDIATFSAYNTAVISLVLTASNSTAATIVGKTFDIAGASRYIATSTIYSSASTVSAMLTVSISFGDDQTEPAGQPST